MPISELTDPDAVRSAIAEFDQLGRDNFLSKYGYARARQYVLQLADGVFYDSKAIAGVAYGYQFPDHGPLSNKEFSGGEATVKMLLDGLGFEVVRLGETATGLEVAPRNPPWIRDELILALDLYERLADRRFSHDSSEIVECSAVLNRLRYLLGTATSATLRNPNGVYMKLMNFRRFDPTFTAAGRSGLSRGNRLEEDVWNDFHGDPARLAKVAKAIRDQLDAGLNAAPGREGLSAVDDNDDFEAPEGRILTAQHRRRERSRELVGRKKAQALAKLGRVACVACGFEFAGVYGDRGRGFIECHHTQPVESLGDGARTKLSDLALVCANCHRMIHARRPWLSIPELQLIVRDKG